MPAYLSDSPIFIVVYLNILTELQPNPNPNLCDRAQ